MVWGSTTRIDSGPSTAAILVRAAVTAFTPKIRS